MLHRGPKTTSQKLENNTESAETPDYVLLAQVGKQSVATRNTNIHTHTRTYGSTRHSTRTRIQRHKVELMLEHESRHEKRQRMKQMAARGGLGLSCFVCCFARLFVYRILVICLFAFLSQANSTLTHCVLRNWEKSFLARSFN